MALHKLLFKIGDFTEHDIIADGRCFSGAAYYVLVSKGKPFSPKTKKADSDTLNDWIKSDIIDPIIAIGRDPTDKNFLSYLDWVHGYNLVPDTRVEGDYDATLEADLNDCFESIVHNLLNSASNDLDTLNFINVESGVLPGIFKVSNANEITREMINNKKQENALRIMQKACFKKYEKNYLDYIKNLASKGWTEPNYGPAQVLSNKYKKNVIVLVDHSGDLTPAFMTSPENKTENNVYIKTGFYMFEGNKYGAGHFYALELKDRTTGIRAKEDAGLEAAIKASLKSEEARKASLKAEVVVSPAETTSVPPNVASTSIPHLKCDKPKTKIPIYYVIFTAPNQLGDYNYMIKQPEYKNTLFIFNDNVKDNSSYAKGSGNAEIRPYNSHGFQRMSLTKPLSAGIPTGDGKSKKGYSALDQLTKTQIDLAIGEIDTILEKFKYDQIIYSGTNNKITGFSDDPGELIGISKYDVNKSVRNYITKQIQCLGDFKGKLEKNALKDLFIQNVAVMLFVNNSANVVFVRDKEKKTWMLPGGRIDNKETPWAAAAREYEEETGSKLPSNLQEKDFDYYDQQHTTGEYTRIFIGKTDVKSPPYNISRVKNQETDNLECRLLSDVLANEADYSPVILKSTKAIYNKINKEGAYLNYANPEIASPSTSTSLNTAPKSTITTAPQVSNKNVRFSSVSEKRSTPNKYVQESFPRPKQKNNNNNNSNKNNNKNNNKNSNKNNNNNNSNNNITDSNQYARDTEKIEDGYVMAANSIDKYNNAPFTSNPKRHIAMGTGAGLAVLAGLAFAGGRKETHTRKKKKKTQAGTRKHSRKTLSGFSLNKRRKVKKCCKTQKKRR